MPELPEVETTRRSLLPHVVGRRLESVTVRDARLRWPVDVGGLTGTLPGRVVRDIRRRAKYLLFDIEDDWVLMVHLGMSGRLGMVAGGAALEIHDHVLWAFDDGRELRLNDARRFGSVDLFAASDELAHPRLAHLGIEPLGAGFGGRWLFDATRGLKKPIKNYLMDAHRIVGVGNIYACEALWQARVDPVAPAGRLSRARCDRLARAVRGILRQAIGKGGTTLRDFADADGRDGEFRRALRVYGREGEPCSRCGRRIRRITQVGRSTFSCSRCQR